MKILEIDHVQLAMPVGEEDKARKFHGNVLGLREVTKPENLARRGGVWFGDDRLKVHLGVEAEFRPARKAHPAFKVEGLRELRARCESAGYKTIDDEPIAGYDRFYVHDPFGNRIECLEPHEK